MKNAPSKSLESSHCTSHSASNLFLELVERGVPLVDKTLFVKSFLECYASVPLITRPRRWGKTFNLHLLEAFLSIPLTPQGEVDQAVVAKRRAIFERFQIGQEKKIMEKHLARYPVIFLTFQSVQGETYEEILTQLQGLFLKAYQTHAYLLESPQLDPFEKSRFRSYLDRLDPDFEWSFAMNFLMKVLRRHWGKRVMLLIDEYDAPLNRLVLEARSKQEGVCLERLLVFFETFLGSCLKGSEDCLEKAVVMGISKMVKANLSASVNNLGEFSILELSPGTTFLKDFGFTREEVEELVKQGHPPEGWLKGVQAWYGGYSLAGVDFYSPGSVISWLANAGDFRSYWVQTPLEEILKEALWEGLSSSSLQPLLAHEEVEFFLSFPFCVSDLGHPYARENLLWDFLVSSGYLSVRTVTSSDSIRQFPETLYWVRIPNREMQLQWGEGKRI